MGHQTLGQCQGEMNYSAELGYNQGLKTQVEMDRLERKRERNRVAANKCRLRKLERISQLDKEVNKLKEENSELALVRQKLEEEARDLREMLKSTWTVDASLEVILLVSPQE